MRIIDVTEPADNGIGYSGAPWPEPRIEPIQQPERVPLPR